MFRPIDLQLLVGVGGSRPTAATSHTNSTSSLLLPPEAQQQQAPSASTTPIGAAAAAAMTPSAAAAAKVHVPALAAAGTGMVGITASPPHPLPMMIGSSKSTTITATEPFSFFASSSPHGSNIISNNSNHSKTNLMSSASALSLKDRLGLLRLHFPHEVIDALGYGGRGDGSDDACFPHDELIEALQIAPHLILEETPIERFVRQVTSSMNSSSTSSSSSSTIETGDDNTDMDQNLILQKAVRRLASYWKWRKRIFHEYAYLPMVMNPSSPLPSKTNTTSTASATTASTKVTKTFGALSEQDMEVLNSGFLVVLPSSTCPKGRTVCVMDRSKLGFRDKDPKYRDSITRIHFYFAHVASATNPASQTHGMVCIEPVTSLSPQYGNDAILPVYEEAFPIKNLEFHALFLPSNIRAVANVVFVFAAYLFKLMTGRSFLILHFGLTDENAIHKLIDSGGFNRADLAVWAGGTNGWNMENFREWQKKRYRMEERLFQNKEIIERKRAANAKRSKIKRERAKARYEVLQHDVQSLKDANASMKDENTRLETLLAHAQLTMNVLQQLGATTTAIMNDDDSNDVDDSSGCQLHKRGKIRRREEDCPSCGDLVPEMEGDF